MDNAQKVTISNSLRLQYKLVATKNKHVGFILISVIITEIDTLF